MNKENTYFQLRIPRGLKNFFDDYVKSRNPLGISSGNELMRLTLISKANELLEGLKTRKDSEDQSTK